MNRNNVAFGVCVLSLFMIAPKQQADHEKLLSIKDVEEVTGVEGIKLVPRNPVIGAGGELNFALADETLLLMVAIQDAPMYDEWKSQEGFFHESVPELGDEAFQGPSFGEYRYTLIFRKGDRAIALSSFFNMQAGGEPFLNQEQLRQIAKIVISRL